MSSLDAPSDAELNTSHRYSGLVLLVHITYTNLETFNPNKFSYKITVERVKGTLSSATNNMLFAVSVHALFICAGLGLSESESMLENCRALYRVAVIL